MRRLKSSDFETVNSANIDHAAVANYIADDLAARDGVVHATISEKYYLEQNHPQIFERIKILADTVSDYLIDCGRADLTESFWRGALAGRIFARPILGISRNQKLDFTAAIDHFETSATDVKTLVDIGQSIVMTGWKEIESLPMDYADLLDEMRREVSENDFYDLFGAGFGAIIAAARQEKQRTLRDAEICAEFEKML